jgi:hypothetical protein
MSALLAGGGSTFNVPSWRDLDNDAENVSSMDQSALQAAIRRALGAGYTGVAATVATELNADFDNNSVPDVVQSSTEIAVRLSRNKSWTSMDLSAQLAGADALESIADRVGFYWARRLQAAFIATYQGVSKENGSGPDSGDYASDISGASFVDGVTNFSAEAFLDAAVTMGDSMEALTGVMVHSVVYNRMQKNNLIDFVPDSTGLIQIATFLGREVIVDDAMPTGTSAVLGDGTDGEAGIYETWLFGRGQGQLGIGSAKVPTETERTAAAGNGGGQEVLHSRVEWAIHPTGHAYIGTPATDGGPANGTGSGDLNIAGSWDRRFPDRAQVHFARLVTRES